MYQKEEISEILYVPYRKFKEMVTSKQKDLIYREEEFNLKVLNL